MKRSRAALFLFYLLAGHACSVQADDRFLVGGILDLEAFVTDDRSRTLSRNGGDPAFLGRIQLWSAIQLTSNLQAFAHLEAEADNFPGDWKSEAELEQAGLRWSFRGTPYTVVELGKFISPFGSILARSLSTQNPLIGEPQSIYTGYPRGGRVSGSKDWFDYYLAWVDAPVVLEDYLPGKPGSAYRPDAGIGFTPATGLRIGLSWTEGPYLNKSVSTALPPGSGWRDFDQKLYGVDLQYSHGYMEFTGMIFRSEYDVPYHDQGIDGVSYIAELKYTWTPRIYTALRYERNNYPFIRQRGNDNWLAREALVHDLEIGAAYRFSADTQMKLAYRRDRGKVVGTPGQFPDGWSIGLQLSWGFDMARLLRGSAW